MVGRFVDNSDFVAEAKLFAKRDHGTPIWWIITSFFVASLFILLSLNFISTNNTSSLAASIISIMVGLLALTCYFAIKDKNTITTVELQNAIFSEVAKLAANFCMIIKYDGSILYVTPEYSRSIFKGVDIGSISLNWLEKSHIIDRIEKEKLCEAVSSGAKRAISLKSPLLIAGDESHEFIVEPIGIYQKSASRGRLILAKKRSANPSGYFLLRKRRIPKDANKLNISEFGIGQYTINGKGGFASMDERCRKILDIDPDNKRIEKIKFDSIFKDDRLIKKHKSGEAYQAVTQLNNNNGVSKILLCQQPLVKSDISAKGVVVALPKNNVPKKISPDTTLDIIGSSPIATAVLNPQGQVLRSNKPFRLITERLGSGDKQWSLLDSITDDMIDETKTILKDIVSGKHDSSTPIDIKIDGDKELSASLYVSLILDEEGETQNIIAHLIDITELKNLELRFVHSQKMQAVGQLAGGIAHDFNNLLTAMMGFCDLLLLRHPAGDQSFADIMQVKQNANRAANLVRQLLAFSRKQTLQPEVIVISDVLADLTNLIGRLIGENIELKMLHGRSLGNVKVDQGQLEQVIINLAVNARDAMSDGGILTIKTSNYTVDEKHKISRNMLPPDDDEKIEDGDYVLIEIVDSGCGIDKGDVGKIFEPFYSTKEIGAGTGLGLSTVYGIIKQTDGYIYVSSRIGKGTKFSIFLKRYNEEDSFISKKEQDRVEGKSPPAELAGKGNILLVEDEAPVRLFSKSALKSKGYTVFEADCAETALEIVEEKGDDVDIIITDVMMPGMSGPDMIKIISEKHPDTKVIFMSGYGEDAFIESFGEDRKFNFLSKPYTLKQLATKVKDVVEE